MKVIFAFKCDFCDYINEDQNNTKIHELGCERNPINKKCQSCKHFFHFTDSLNEGVFPCDEEQMRLILNGINGVVSCEFYKEEK